MGQKVKLTEELLNLFFIFMFFITLVSDNKTFFIMFVLYLYLYLHPISFECLRVDGYYLE